MARENVELLHERSPEHLRMGTARLKSDKKKIEEDGKKRLNMERSTAGTKIRSPDCLTVLSRLIRLVHAVTSV